MLDPDTQIRFSQKKGSIPARLDLDMSSLDICAQKAVKLLADKNHQVPAADLQIHQRAHTSVSFLRDTPVMLRDLFRIRWNGMRGRYR